MEFDEKGGVSCLSEERQHKCLPHLLCFFCSCPNGHGQGFLSVCLHTWEVAGCVEAGGGGGGLQVAEVRERVLFSRSV